MAGFSHMVGRGEDTETEGSEMCGGTSATWESTFRSVGNCCLVGFIFVLVILVFVFEVKTDYINISGFHDSFKKSTKFPGSHLRS